MVPAMVAPLCHPQLLGPQGDGHKYKQKILIDRGAQTCRAESLNFSEVA